MTNDNTNTVVTVASTIAALNFPVVKSLVDNMKSNARKQQNTLPTLRPAIAQAPFPHNNTPLPTMSNVQRNKNMEALVAAVASIAASDSSAASNSGSKPVPVSDL